MSKKLVIIAHMPSDNTRALCEAVARGALHSDIEGVCVDCLNPFEATAQHVLPADGVIFGTTENLGYMSGALKDFFDRTFYDLLEQKQGTPYALYVRAGHDGTGTLRAFETIVTNGLRWKPVCDPLVCRGGWQDQFVKDVEDLGTLMAAGLEAGVF